MIYNLKCNNLNCRKLITKIFLLTSCGHIFCTGCIQNIKQTLKCQACYTYLKKDDLTIHEQQAKPFLIGTSPDVLFEEFQKAINFYVYQLTEELEVTKAENQALNSRLLSDNEMLKGEIEKIRSERDLVNHKMKQLEERLEREKENAYMLDTRLVEKNRDMQKLLECNEKLRFGLRSSMEGRSKKDK